MSYKNPLFSILITIFTLFTPFIAQAADNQLSVATLFSLEGSAVVIRKGDTLEQSLKVGDSLFVGDRIKIGSKSRAGLQFQDGGFVRLGSLAALTFEGNQQEKKVDIASGNAYFFSRSPEKYPSITTPTVSAALRGTEFSVLVSPDETTVGVLEGKVELNNKYGSALLSAGEGARVKRGEAPTKQQLINLPDTVQWMVQVPFFGDWSDYGSNEVTSALSNGDYSQSKQRAEWMNTFSRAAKQINEGQYETALTIIGPKPNQPELKLLAARAALASGDIAQGKAGLEELSNNAPQLIASSARSSLALLQLTQGDISQAKQTLAQSGSEESYSALTAQSLVAQADRKIEDSIEYLDRAIAKYPQSVTLKVRKAELALASGELDVAEEYINQSLEADDSGYTNAIAGFINLANGEREAAEKNFIKAQQSRSSAALGFLGGALLHTARGEQAAGIEMFQQAVLIDPKNSLLRSYLGKAFSEANREESAQNEYQKAMDLDPNDPTPWIYQSYSKIAQNRPVEALSDIEESISRNNNRAVFRSSFLLDQDSAVRSANLARIFNELGFADAGRIEAIKSISKQYTNFSAHRLLAETQDTIFLADASLSERRISDLTAPLSLNLFDSVSGNVTLNEYSALFERDQTRFAFGGDFYSFDDLYAPTLLVAGKDNKFGYSFSAGAINRDGTNQGNSNQDYRIGSILQYQPSWHDRFSLQTTGQFVRTRDFNAYEQDVDLTRYGVDLGWLHTFKPGVMGVFNSSLQRYFDNGNQLTSDQIFSTQIFEGESDTQLVDVIYDRSRDSYLTSVQNQAQLVVDGKWLTSVVGAAITNIRSDRFDDPEVLEDSIGELTGQGVTLPTSSENQLTSSSLYAYETAHVTDWMHLTAGLAHETVETELREIPAFVQDTDTKHRFSPKFGLIANPVDNLTLRTSYSEGMRKSTLEDQISIEPTMVGGINQRFNDLSGTRNRQFGVGIDWKIPQSTYTGIEWSRRNITEPVNLALNEFEIDFDNETTTNNVVLDDTSYQHGEQDFIRGYFSQVLATRWVATLDNRYFNQRLPDTEETESIKDNRSTATIKYFDTSGLILFSRALWRYQDRVGNFAYDSDPESFWHFDAGAGYRLMGRHGIVRLEVRNLLDKSFDLDQSTGFEEFLSPSRAVYLTARFNY